MAGKKTLRARDRYSLQVGDERVNVSPTERYAPTDPVVKAHRWAFVSDDELATIETTDATPGQKRTLAQ